MSMNEFNIGSMPKTESEVRDLINKRIKNDDAEIEVYRKQLANKTNDYIKQVLVAFDDAKFIRAHQQDFDAVNAIIDEYIDQEENMNDSHYHFVLNGRFSGKYAINKLKLPVEELIGSEKDTKERHSAFEIMEHKINIFVLYSRRKTKKMIGSKERQI